jgi:hypothetical protein
MRLDQATAASYRVFPPGTEVVLIRNNRQSVAVLRTHYQAVNMLVLLSDN